MPRPGKPRAVARPRGEAQLGRGEDGRAGRLRGSPPEPPDGVYAQGVLTLWQAEWCPYSARVREALTEYGIDFVAKQVAAEKANRRAMREATGTDEIPLLVRDDGTQLSDWHEMLDWIRATYDRPDDADRHREKWFQEAPERDPNHVLT